MSKAVEKLQAAQQRAMAIRPKVGGFPYLAEVLRQAGVNRSLWFLPSCQSLYLMDDGAVVTQGTPRAVQAYRMATELQAVSRIGASGFHFGT